MAYFLDKIIKISDEELTELIKESDLCNATVINKEEWIVKQKPQFNGDHIKWIFMNENDDVADYSVATNYMMLELKNDGTRIHGTYGAIKSSGAKVKIAEISWGKTPNGGDYSMVFYGFGGKDNMCEIVEYKYDGTFVQSTIWIYKAKPQPYDAKKWMKREW